VKRPIWLSLSKTPPHKKKYKNENNEEKYYPNPSYSSSKIPYSVPNSAPSSPRYVRT
jgi:hypothetical protein